MKTNLDIVKEYFGLLEAFSDERSAFERILHREFRQKEFPNILNKNGQESDFEDSLKRAGLGSKVLSKQTYEITHHIETESEIVVEALWRGRMAVDAGPLKANQEIKAQFCIVCEFKDGKIVRQRNYDCFYPF